jgi:ADP-L-glycero-D-manno-heptose 6-epimerase
VTGGFGFIGSNLIMRLNKLGKTDIVIVDDLTDSRKLTNLENAEFTDYYDVDTFFQTFTDWDCLTQIFHEGAISSTREMNGKLIMSRNYEFSSKLMKYAIEYNIPFQYASSASIYGNIEVVTSIREDYPFKPQTPYAHSKALFDTKVFALNDCYQIQGLRYFNVCGPNEGHKGDQASPVHKFIKQAQETERIKIFQGSDSIFRDFISVDDVVSIKLELAQRKTRGIFNVGTGTPHSFDLIAKIIAEMTNAKIDIIPFPEEYKSKYQYWTCADMSRLGFEHKFKLLEDICSNVFDSLK